LCSIHPKTTKAERLKEKQKVPLFADDMIIYRKSYRIHIKTTGGKTVTDSGSKQ
jgi:hypothetical protein